MPDYREVYFSHSPGLFGCIWFCAYCYRIIVGKENVEVDHIVPLDSRLGVNRRFNLVAACMECNRAKSNKVDYHVPKGYLSKLFDLILFTIQKIVVICFVAVYVAIHKFCSILFSILALPYKSRNLLAAVAATVFYFLLIKAAIGQLV